MSKFKIRVHESNDSYMTALDAELDELIAQGKKDMASFNPKTIKIGSLVWTHENLAIDDGGDGIIYNPDNGEYYYTFDAAVRIANGIPGWHLPSVDDWNRACAACGIEEIEYIGDVEDADVLYYRLNVKPVGYYDREGDLYGVGGGAMFWTSRFKGANAAYERAFESGSRVKMYQSVRLTGNGYSVRLVKD